MIVATGTSSRAVAAMTDHLMIKLRAAGHKPKSEGERQGDWALIDAGDVIVHVFRAEVRAFYNIERIWAAPAQTAVKTAAKAPAKTPVKSPAKTKSSPAPARKAAKKRA